MSDDYLPSILLSVLLTMADLLTAFFSLFCGRLLLDRIASAGYLIISSGVVLLYMSSGLWTKQCWKLYARLGIYGLAFCFFFLGVAGGMALGGPHFMPPAAYAVVVVAAVIIAASWMHLRLTLRQRKGRV
jgi:hypothetical protein